MLLWLSAASVDTRLFFRLPESSSWHILEEERTITRRRKTRKSEYHFFQSARFLRSMWCSLLGCSFPSMKWIISAAGWPLRGEEKGHPARPGEIPWRLGRFYCLQRKPCQILVDFATLTQMVKAWRTGEVFFSVGSHIMFHLKVLNKLELQNGCWLEWRYSSSFCVPSHLRRLMGLLDQLTLFKN